MPGKHPFEDVVEATFRKNLRKPGWLLVDLYGRGCPPCTSQNAEAKIAAGYKSRAELLRMNVENAKGVLEEFQISGIPTLILFKDGSRRSQFVDIPAADGQNVLDWLAEELK